MNEYEKEMVRILKLFNVLNILDNVILVGSWAEFFYAKLIVSFSPNIRTRDIDFYYPKVKIPKMQIDLITYLEEIGYIYDEDILTSKSRFFKYDGFEIEFLTNLSRDRKLVNTIESLKVQAECLSQLDIYEFHYISFKTDYGFIVNLPTPAAYVIHKLIINKDRGEKKHKDIESVRNLLPHLKLNSEYSNDLSSIYNGLSRKQKQSIDKTCLENEMSLFEK